LTRTPNDGTRANGATVVVHAPGRVSKTPAMAAAVMNAATAISAPRPRPSAQ
jgi:hypothetical protein